MDIIRTKVFVAKLHADADGLSARKDFYQVIKFQCEFSENQLSLLRCILKPRKLALLAGL